MNTHGEPSVNDACLNCASVDVADLGGWLECRGCGRGWNPDGRRPLDDTSRCPVGHRCESCGTEAGDLAVETATADRLGVMCLTLCRRCAAYDDQIPVSVGTAVRLVGQHCQHLGIDLDQMAAELERDQ